MKCMFQSDTKSLYASASRFVVCRCIYGKNKENRDCILGKVLGVLYAIMGVIVGAFISLISVAISSFSAEAGAIGALFGVGSIVLLPLFYGVFWVHQRSHPSVYLQYRSPVDWRY